MTLCKGGIFVVALLCLTGNKLALGDILGFGEEQWAQVFPLNFLWLIQGMLDNKGNSYGGQLEYILKNDKLVYVGPIAEPEPTRDYPDKWVNQFYMHLTEEGTSNVVDIFYDFPGKRSLTVLKDLAKKINYYHMQAPDTSTHWSQRENDTAVIDCRVIKDKRAGIIDPSWTNDLVDNGDQQLNNNNYTTFKTNFPGPNRLANPFAEFWSSAASGHRFIKFWDGRVFTTRTYTPGPVFFLPYTFPNCSTFWEYQYEYSSDI